MLNLEHFPASRFHGAKEVGRLPTLNSSLAVILEQLSRQSHRDFCLHAT